MKTIILVEDEEDIRNMYKLKLEIAGYKVIAAEDGKSALRLIKEKKPNLVLLDILIPKKDGFEVLRELKKSKDESIRSMPVIVMSNLSNEKDTSEAKKNGAMDYIVKSKMSPNEILEKVNEYFKKQKQ